MHISTRSRRFGGLLIALGAVLATFASTATAALATINVPLPDGRAAGATGFPSSNRGGIYDPVQTSPAAPVVTVVGGMPGWQIALIAVGAALVAAVVAVLAYRAWTARRQPLAAPRFGSPAQVAGGK
jgi:Zn-dependent protease with chaperone function